MRKHEKQNGASGGVAVAPLRAGDRMTRSQFLHIWEQHPEIKFAELIGGIVHMPSPLSLVHGATDSHVGGWLWYYHLNTPGTETARNATTLMEGDDTTQPDDFLRILPKHGGRSRNEGLYVGGSPELIAEICVSSASYDLHEKLDVYEKNGVQEYVAILMREQEIRWHRISNKGYQQVAPSPGTIWKSKAFPGLWLDGKSMLAGDAAKVLAMLKKGLRTAAHAAFVKKLARNKQKHG